MVKNYHVRQPVVEITAIANKPGHYENYIIVSIAPITILSQSLFEAHCLFYFLEAIIFNVINLNNEIFQFAVRETDVTFDISLRFVAKVAWVWFDLDNSLSELINVNYIFACPQQPFLLIQTQRAVANDILTGFP